MNNDESDLLPLSNDEVFCTPKPFLSNVLNFNEEIRPYPFTLLWSNIGSGKNVVTEKLINGCSEEGFPKLTVLVITSRKTKALETLSKEDLDVCKYFSNGGNVKSIRKNPNLNVKDYTYENVIDGKPVEIIQRSLPCTGAAIERYHQQYYDPNDPSTHLWNRFDIIFWDEVHSLILDSSYQSAPFHVLEFIKNCLWHMKHNPDTTRCKNIVAMTGTPECLQNFSWPTSPHLLDKRDKCREVYPNNIHFILKDDANSQIRQQLADGERIVYFSNCIVLPDDLSKKYGIPNERIAVSFSDEKVRLKLKQACGATKRGRKKKINVADQAENSDRKPQNDFERMEATEKYMAEHFLLHEDISFFLTTSRNKEGINIENNDIRNIYIESHCIPDIRQMAGRIRKGAEHAYIIVDSADLYSPSLAYEDELSRYFSGATTNHKENHLNKVFNDICEDKFDITSLVNNPNASFGTACDEYPEVEKIMKAVKANHHEVQYSYFTNSFCYNPLLQQSKHYYIRENAAFRTASQSKGELEEMFRTAFPHSIVHPYVFPRDEARHYVHCVLREHKNIFTHDEANEIASAVQNIFIVKTGGKPYSNVRANRNRIMKLIGYEFKRCENEKTKPLFDKLKIAVYRKEDKNIITSSENISRQSA